MKKVMILAVMTGLLVCAGAQIEGKTKNKKNQKPHWVKVGREKVDANNQDRFGLVRLGTRKVKLKKKVGKKDIEKEFAAEISIKFTDDKKRYVKLGQITHDEVTADSFIVVFDKKNKGTMIQLDDVHVARAYFLNQEAIVIEAYDRNALIVFNGKGQKLFEYKGDYIHQVLPSKDGFLYTKYISPGEQKAGLYKYTMTNQKDRLLYEYETGNLGFTAVFPFNRMHWLFLKSSNKQILFNKTDKIIYTWNFERTRNYTFSLDGRYLLFWQNDVNINMVDVGSGKLVWRKEPFVYEGTKYYFSIKIEFEDNKVIVPLTLPAKYRGYNRVGLNAVFDMKTGQLVSVKKADNWR